MRFDGSELSSFSGDCGSGEERNMSLCEHAMSMFSVQAADEYGDDVDNNLCVQIKRRRRQKKEEEDVPPLAHRKNSGTKH